MYRLVIVIPLLAIMGCQSKSADQTGDNESPEEGVVAELNIEAGELEVFTGEPHNTDAEQGFQFSFSDSSSEAEISSQAKPEAKPVDNSIDARVQRATQRELKFDYDGALAEWNAILESVENEAGKDSWQAKDIALAIEGVQHRSQLDLNERTKLVELTSLERNAFLKATHGDLVEALRIRAEAVSLAREVFPEQSIAVANCLLAKANAHAAIGQDIESVRSFDQSLAIREKLYGKKHPSYYSVLRTLGLIYQKNQQLQDAEALLSEAVALCGESDGTDSSSYATYLNDLGSLYNLLGNFQEAEKLLVQSLLIREKIYGADDVHCGYSLRNLGVVYFGANNDELALQSLNKAHTILEKSLDPGNFLLLDTKVQLATILVKSGDSVAAESLLRSVADHQATSIGTDHPAYAKTLFMLAVTLGNQGKYGEAEPLLIETSVIQEASFGPSSRELKKTLNTYAVLLQRSGRTDEAAQIQAKLNSIARMPSEPNNQY